MKPKKKPRPPRWVVKWWVREGRGSSRNFSNEKDARKFYWKIALRGYAYLQSIGRRTFPAPCLRRRRR